MRHHLASTATIRQRYLPRLAPRQESRRTSPGDRPIVRPYTIFPPSWFMESLPLFVRDGKAMLIGRQPATIHPVAAADFGRMVARAHRIPAARGAPSTTLSKWCEASETRGRPHGLAA